MLAHFLHALILLHIFTGSLAMVFSVIAFSASKWSVWHQRAGRVFYWSMLVTSLASIPPAIVHGSWVLMMLSVFSFQLTYTGRRYLAFRRGETATWLDHSLVAVSLLFGLGLLLVGLPLFVRVMGIWGAIAPGLFGLVMIAMACEDCQWFRRDGVDQKLALLRHIGRMGGASIAVFTAFLVNVNTFIPGAFAWILPSVLGSFLIAYFSRRLKGGRVIR